MIEPVPTQKLTMEASEVRFWRNELQASEKFQKEMFLDRMGYEKLIKYYESEQHPDGSNPYQITQQDEIYPGVSSIIGTSYYQDPTINAKAKHPIADEVIQLPFAAQVAMMQTGMAPQYQNWDVTYTDLMRDALTYAIKKHGLKGEAQLALFDLIAAGFCVIEANHLTQTEAGVSGEDSGLASGFMDQAKEALGSVVDFVTGKTSEDNAEEKAAQEIDSEGRDYTFDSTYIERWNPTHILFDYRAEVFKKSRYIAKYVDLTVAEFNTKFPAFRGRISPNGSETRTMSYASHKDNANNKCVRVYEMQLKKKTGVCVLKLVMGVDEALDYYELPFKTNGFTLKYGCIDKYGKIYPVSKLYRASKPQTELNHQLTIQTEHSDRSLKKIAVDITGLTQAGKSSLKDPDIYAIVEKNRPSAVFEPMPVGGVAPENEVIQVKMGESINKQLGVNELAKSGKSDSEFATQDQLQNQSFTENTSAIRDALSDVLREVCDTLKDIIMQMWDGEDFFQVTGKQGGAFWYRPEMGKLSDIIQGDYDIDIDITTAERPNPMKDRSEALEMWQFLMTAAPFLMSKGKTLSMAAFDNVVKKFRMNPETLLEDLPMMPGIPGQPLPPGAGSPPTAPNSQPNVSGAPQPAIGGA